MSKDGLITTIVAPVTPPGKGAVGIVRVSGPLVPTIMQAVLHQEIKPRQATFTHFYEQEEKIDEGIALFFPGPHSFTGEDVLELQGHGGPVVMDVLIKHLLTLGAHFARPGEFSERAFLNGKLDLAEAEAIADLIDASSREASRAALRSLDGEFSTRIEVIQRGLTNLRMLIEANIDFSDEDIEVISVAQILSNLQHLTLTMQTLLSETQQGALLREGVTVVIVGEPNVGKSSLLNRLSQKEVAIVTDIPGTTRDVLRSHILIDGLPLHIVDTAGLRASSDVVEQEGIRRAHVEMQKADLILYLFTATEEHRALAARKAQLAEALQVIPFIFVRNKIDLINATANILHEKEGAVVSLSIKNNEGLDLLKACIKKVIGFQSSEGMYSARRRHVEAIKRALLHIQAAETQVHARRGIEMLAEELRLSQESLGKITGKFTADDLLGKIFSSFCIGK